MTKSDISNLFFIFLNSLNPMGQPAYLEKLSENISKLCSNSTSFLQKLTLLDRIWRPKQAEKLRLKNTYTK